MSWASPGGMFVPLCMQKFRLMQFLLLCTRTIYQGVCPLGTTPIRLRWTYCAECIGRGPFKRPRVTVGKWMNLLLWMLGDPLRQELHAWGNLQLGGVATSPGCSGGRHPSRWAESRGTGGVLIGQGPAAKKV